MPNKKERAKFLPLRSLHPTWKGGAPFQCWVIDSITGLPPDSDGCTAVVIAVDAFTKWVEAQPVRNRSAVETAAFLHRNIVCRFGRPLVVRSD
jgi:Integrase core domain